MRMGFELVTVERAGEDTQGSNPCVMSGQKVNDRVAAGNHISNVVHARGFHDAMDQVWRRAPCSNFIAGHHCIQQFALADAPSERFQDRRGHITGEPSGQAHLDPA